MEVVIVYHRDVGVPADWAWDPSFEQVSVNPWGSLEALGRLGIDQVRSVAWGLQVNIALLFHSSDHGIDHFSALLGSGFSLALNNLLEES